MLPCDVKLLCTHFRSLEIVVYLHTVTFPVDSMGKMILLIISLYCDYKEDPLLYNTIKMWILNTFSPSLTLLRLYESLECNL